MRRWKRLVNTALIAVALAASALVVRHLATSGWPLHHANPWLVAVAAVLLFGAYAAKALGWRHLFASADRPATLTLAGAAGAASVAGIALPGRFDELVRLAVVRRCRRGHASVAAVLISIFLLALLDSAALAPFASVAAGVTRGDGWIRAGLALVALAGVAAWSLVLALPRLVRLPFVARFRFAGWVGDNAPPTRQAAWALAWVAVSWTLRALALVALLAGLGLGLDVSAALGFLCASSASAALPVAPAGAATQAGAGAAMLIASGVHAEQALAFGVASQGLGILVGLAFVLAFGSWHVQGRLPALARRFA